MPTAKNVATLSNRAQAVLAQVVISTGSASAEELLAHLWREPRLLDREPNCGDYTRREICEWLGFPYDAARQATRYWTSQNSEPKVREAIKLLQRFGFVFKYPDRLPRELPRNVLKGREGKI